MLLQQDGGVAAISLHSRRGAVTHASRQIRSKHSSAYQSRSLSLRWGSSGSDIAQVLAMVVETIQVIDHSKIRQKGYLSGLRQVVQDTLASVDVGLDQLLQQATRLDGNLAEAAVEQIHCLRQWWETVHHGTEGPTVCGQRLGSLDKFVHWKAGNGDEVTVTWLHDLATETEDRFQKLDQNLANKACYAILALKTIGVLQYVAEDCIPDSVSDTVHIMLQVLHASVLVQ